MKNYQKPDLEYVVLTTAEEIANSNDDFSVIGGVTNSPFRKESLLLGSLLLIDFYKTGTASVPVFIGKIFC